MCAGALTPTQLQICDMLTCLLFFCNGYPSSLTLLFLAIFWRWSSSSLTVLGYGCHPDCMMFRLHL